MTEIENQKFLNMMIADFSKDIELTEEVKLARRIRICDFEDALKTLPQSYNMEEFNEGRVFHHFGTGVYSRELFIPKGQVIVSKIHRGKTTNFIMQGAVTVISEEGISHFEAPYIFVSDPFTKRIVISQTDLIWATAHGTDKTDLKEIEEEIIAKDFTELNQLQGGSL